MRNFLHTRKELVKAFENWYVYILVEVSFYMLYTMFISKKICLFALICFT